MAPRKPLTDLAAAPPPGGERVPVGVVFEALHHYPNISPIYYIVVSVFFSIFPI